jgi:NADPH2:quinone reductase
LNLLLLKGASLVGVFWGDFAKREPRRNAEMLGQLAHWYLEGKIRPVLDARLPMAQLPQAFERMASRQVVGKVVLSNP